MTFLPSWDGRSCGNGVSAYRRIVVTTEAKRHLSEIKDERAREVIKQALRNLAIEPEKQGKALTGRLEGYRGVRVVGQRYRVIYKAEGQTITVYVVAVGMRKEGDKAGVYEVANKLFQAYIEKRSRHKKPTGQ